VSAENNRGKPNSVEEVAAQLSRIRRAVIISHYNPDADAYGAACALSIALRAKGIETLVVNQSGAERRYFFIAGVNEVVKSWQPQPGETLIVCDCGDLKRVGDSLCEQVAKAECVIAIDHHASNDYFGTYNLVNERACATSELVYQLLQALRIPLGREISTALMAGIMGDTGCFRYTNTSPFTFEVAQALMQAGALPHQVGHELYGRNSLGSVKLHAVALANIKLHFADRLCELVVTQEMLDSCKATSADTELLVEKGRDIDGVEISYLARKEAELWHVSLRSVRPECDVSQAARKFGGGGHKNAAAFRWRKEYTELAPQLLAELEKLL
jgi:bifunctional oligoribonuclease and PAP phosphatase NrnA